MTLLITTREPPRRDGRDQDSEFESEGVAFPGLGKQSTNDDFSQINARGLKELQPTMGPK